MSELDVRWKQRVHSYRRALGLLQDALKAGTAPLNSLEKEGTVQRFEFTLELGWNVLKDYLEANGTELPSVTPRSVVKAAFAARLISEGQAWEDMLQWRNWLSHRYDEALLNEGVDLIHARFLPAFEDLSAVFQRLEQV